MPPEGERRAEILDTAARMFASSGLRTSLKEIADACGIQAGSLYHHFASKEAIIIELVQRYRDELDRLAKDALNALHEPGGDIEPLIVAFGRAIAACGVRNRAALLLTLYEPPTVLGEELVRLARQTPTAIDSAMLDLLRAGRDSGTIRPGVDLELLAVRLCQSMLHVGVGVSHLSASGQRVPDLRLRILLHGLARWMPSRRALDRSGALSAARQVIDTWDDDGDDPDRSARLRAVARVEFGRRGYEATTIRDIAAAGGLSTGTVYRYFGSKDELLASIMRSYWGKFTTAWDAVLGSSSSPLEKLDALTWVNINVIDRFADEFKIQLAWLRQSPPSSPNLWFSFLSQLRQVRHLLAAGSRAGEIHLDGGPADVRARCVFEAIFMPEHIVRAAGTRAAHGLARDTVLAGATTR